MKWWYWAIIFAILWTLLVLYEVYGMPHVIATPPYDNTTTYYLGNWGGEQSVKIYENSHELHIELRGDRDMQCHIYKLDAWRVVVCY